MEKNKDYYLDENGLMVLTEEFLKRRGRCCKGACRHCPYGFKRDEPDDKKDKRGNSDNLKG